MVIGRHSSSFNIMYKGAPLEQVKQFIYLGASFNEKGYTTKEVKRGVAIAKKSQWRPAQVCRNRELPIPLKRTTRSINDLTGNELRFRDMYLRADSAEHDQRM